MSYSACPPPPSPYAQQVHLVPAGLQRVPWEVCPYGSGLGWSTSGPGPCPGPEAWNLVGLGPLSMLLNRQQLL